MFNFQKSIQKSFLLNTPKDIDFRKLATSEPLKINFKNFLGSECGRFDVKYNNTNFECLLIDSNVKRLFVCFSAAGRKKQDTLFQRLGWCRQLNGICLYIEDPMYKENKGLECGWFYGTEKESYLVHVNKIIEKILQERSINSQDVVFLGSSSAGYAALYSANLLQGSIAYAYNPQITPKNWLDADNFQRITKINLDGQDAFNRKSLKNIAENNKSKFLIFYNLASKHDQKQFNPWFDELGIKKNDGLKVHNNIYFFVKEINNHNSHFCVADIHDFISILSFLKVDDVNLPELTNIYLESFKSKVMLDEKLYYSTLWFNYLKKGFPLFLVDPSNISETYVNFKVKNYEDVFIYRTSSQKISKSTELVCYILKNNISFRPTFINKIKTIALKLSLNVHVYENEFIRISKHVGHIDDAHVKFTSFIESLHFYVFSTYALEEIQFSENKDIKKKAIQRSYEHIGYLSKGDKDKFLDSFSEYITY